MILKKQILLLDCHVYFSNNLLVNFSISVMKRSENIENKPEKNGHFGFDDISLYKKMIALTVF